MQLMHRRSAAAAPKGLEPRSAASLQRGVLLINLGTPDGPDRASVGEYLAEFLSDPAVVHLPSMLRWLNRPLGRAIAAVRAPRSAALYRKIWSKCGSPLRSLTEEQAAQLRAKLPDGWHVFFAMRYGHPSIAETLEQIEASGVAELVVLPMYPQFSGTTTGTALRELYGSLQRGHHQIHVLTRNTWFDDGGYVYAQAKLIAEYAGRHQLTPDDTFLLFSAHGLPESYVRNGDPYPWHLGRTVDLVLERLGWPAHRCATAYQSRIGPGRWLKPNTDEFLTELRAAGEEKVLVCPVSFTTDCLETLEEIDSRCRAVFEQKGRELFLCPALNSFEPFINALKNLVLEGPRPVSAWGERATPLLAPRPQPASADPDMDSLVMVGVSVPNRIGKELGPRLRCASEAELHRIKKPQCDIPGILRTIYEQGDVREAMLWNTCHRFEFYGWSGHDDSVAARRCIVGKVRDHLLDGEDAGDLSVNVLFGAEAWHHMVRTVAGLNSGLPGDRDVIEQLQTAYRLAEKAGTAGPLAKRLVGDVVEMEARLRRETAWGHFDPGYCFAALSQIVRTSGLDLAAARIVVIGGSTTSRSVLATLAERFEVPRRRMTLVYRGHSGNHLKLLRKAIGSGKRLRVQSYSDRPAIEAIAEADIVLFGIDRDDPVLGAGQLAASRDLGARPLTLIDFNTFGSTRGFASLPGVTLWDAAQVEEAVQAYADAMCAAPQFAEAVEAAERWILEHRPVLRGIVTKPHRCHGLAGGATRDATEVASTCVDGRWSTCVQCGRRNQEEGDAVIAGSRRS